MLDWSIVILVSGFLEFIEAIIEDIHEVMQLIDALIHGVTQHLCLTESNLTVCLQLLSKLPLRGQLLVDQLTVGNGSTFQLSQPS